MTSPMPPAVFIGCHPDDLELAMSVALAEHLAAGAEVHAVLLSRGRSSGALGVLNGVTVSSWWGLRHDPVAEGYQPLTAETMGNARVAEAWASLAVLSAGLPGTLHTHSLDLPDGQITQQIAATAIRALVDEIAPGQPVRMKTHSHVVDDHTDHLAAARAARQLRTEDPVRFGDLRHYVLPAYWADPRLSQVTEGWDTPNSTEVTARIRNAVRQYEVWLPSAGRYAIGYHSVAPMLDQLSAAPKCMVHS